MLPSPLRAQAWLATFALIAPALVLGFLFLAASSKQRPSPCDGLCSPSDDVLLFAFPMMFLCIAIWLVAALLIPCSASSPASGRPTPSFKPSQP